MNILKKKPYVALSLLLSLCVLITSCNIFADSSTVTTVGTSFETTESIESTVASESTLSESESDEITTLEDSEIASTTYSSETTESEETVETTETTEITETTEAVETSEASETSDSASVEVPALSAPVLDLDSIPEYTDKPYVEINGNMPFFAANQIVCESYEYYSPLDRLGRCGVAVVCAGRDLMPTEERGSISSVTPTGWHSVSYDVSGGSLYNRSHLIGFQISGENANKSNLITGTKFLNMVGMLPFENLISDYITETGNHVMYRVTPIFKGDELVARGVLMEGWSVEDNGEEICFNVYLYNVQPGVIINYATGESSLDENYAPSGDVPNYYIINVSSKKFHYTYCSSVGRMSEANKKEVYCTRDELIESGHSPCGTCNP